VLAAVRAVPAEAVSEDLIPRVRRAVAERAPAPAIRPHLWARLAIPAAVLTGLIAVSFALRAPVHRGARVADEAAPLAQVAAPGGEGRGLAAFGRGGRAGGAGAPRASVSEEFAPPPPSLERIEVRADVDAPEREAAAEPAAGERGERQREGPPGPLLRNDRTMSGYAPEGRAGPQRPYRRAHPYQFRDAGEERAARAKGEAAAPPGPPGPPGVAAPFDAMAGPEQAGPAFAATVLVAEGEERLGIALRLRFQRPLEELRLTVGESTSHVRLWDDSVRAVGPIPINAEQLGPGPGSLPVSLAAEADRRDYRLFIPVVARLGETSSSAPVGRYKGEPMSHVLADFSALTGLVILGEMPLGDPVTGDIPVGPPAAALAQFAEKVGFEAEQEGALALTLTHAR
jgi:hypothetical protein